MQRNCKDYAAQWSITIDDRCDEDGNWWGNTGPSSPTQPRRYRGKALPELRPAGRGCWQKQAYKVYGFKTNSSISTTAKLTYFFLEGKVEE